MSLRYMARRSPLVVFFALLSATHSSAQITNVTADQAPPKPGVGHDYIGLLNETVNPATGSVSIRIGVPTPPGREFTQPFAFTYDSNSAYHRIGAGAFTDNLGWLARGGWTYQVPHLVFQTHQFVWQSIGNNFPYTCNFWNSFVFTDLHGETHSLAMAAFQANNTQNCVWPAGSPPSDILSGGDTYVQSTAKAHAPTAAGAKCEGGQLSGREHYGWISCKDDEQ